MSKQEPQLVVYDLFSNSYKFATLKEKRTSQSLEIEDILKIGKRAGEIKRFTRKKLPSINPDLITDPIKINQYLREFISSGRDFAKSYKAEFYDVVLDRKIGEYEREEILRGMPISNRSLVMGNLSLITQSDPNLVYPVFNLYNPA